MKKKLLAVAGVSACALGLGLGVPAMASASAAAVSYEATLNPITANKVTGNGTAWVTLNGNSAEIKLQVNGLLDGAPHAQHIHVDALGQCPGDAQAKDHNGQLSVNVADGVPLYGAIGASLTTEGDTSPAAALNVAAFPSSGSYTYTRTFDLDPNVVANLQKGTAVLVVHGIDYNGNGTYDGVLGASELDPSLPAEATDPALCGAFKPMQMAGVPAGSADTGGGSTASGLSATEIAAGSAAVLAVAGAGAIAYRRRRPAQD